MAWGVGPTGPLPLMVPPYGGRRLDGSLLWSRFMWEGTLVAILRVFVDRRWASPEAHLKYMDNKMPDG